MVNVLTTLAVVMAVVCILIHDSRLTKLEKQIKDLDIKEYRCAICAELKSCPAAGTGVCYPCEHFKEENKDGIQE